MSNNDSTTDSSTDTTTIRQRFSRAVARGLGDREPEAGCYEPARRAMTDGGDRSGFARCGACGDTHDDVADAMRCCGDRFDDGDEEDGGPPVALPDGGCPDPQAFQIPTIDDLDAMRVDRNLSQRELSRRAGLEEGRFHHILRRDVDPQSSTLRALLDVLKAAEPRSIGEVTRRGPKPEPSTVADSWDDVDTDDLVTDGGVRMERARRADVASAGQQHAADQHPPTCPHGHTECTRFGRAGPTCWRCFRDGGER